MNGIANMNELGLDEFEKVSGGSYTGRDYAPDGNAYVLPKTHEEIDEKWDIVQSVLETCGVDVAYIVSQKLQVLAGGSELLREYSTNIFRKRMHDDLDGKLSGMDRFSRH